MERQTSPKEKGALRQALDAYLFLSGIGIFFCAVLGVCMYAGSLVDEAFSLGHKGIFSGILVGFPLALFSVYRRVRLCADDVAGSFRAVHEGIQK